ncbi:MAG TPA: glycosyltransferase family 39 protein [Polyangiaceae bacterium]|nr:glycosyltransferase family 39 protein [Polyangiaceae bacterium]
MIAALLLMGFWLRARGYLYHTFPLWLDEADWAVRLFELPLREHLIRPLGFMALSKALTALFSRSEAGLRFIPWVSGVAALFLTPLLAKRLFNSGAARLLCVAAIALEPAAIDLSKEFKPYSLGLLLHMSLLMLVLRYVATGKTSDLAWLCALALPAVLFTQDILFAYPAIFLTPAIEALRARRTRHLAIVVLTTLATFAVVVLLYVFIWRQMNMKTEETYWGNKYNTFYVAGPEQQSHWVWFYERYRELADFPALRATHWRPIPMLKQSLSTVRERYFDIWLALHVIGVITIFARRRFREGFLLCSPLWLLAFANFLGLFPMASFRADFFVLAYIAPIAAFSFERAKPGVLWLDQLPALVLLTLPLFVFERDWHSYKSYMASWSQYPQMFERVLELRNPAAPRAPLALDERSCAGWNYYVKYQPDFSTRVAPELLRHFAPSCVIESDERTGIRKMFSAVKPEAGSDARGWLLITSDNQIFRYAARTIPANLEIERSVHVTGKHLILEIVRKQGGPPH